jgi:HEAT repeat protein
MRKFLFYSFLSFFFFLSSPILSEDLKSKVDDLFIKASSGTEKDRDLVEPSKNSLIKMGKDAVPYLVEKLDTQDAREILTLIDILSKIGEPAVLPLLDCLKSENKDKIKTASRILGDIKDKRAVKSLSGLLDNADYNIRANACASLGKIGDSTVLDNIIFLLEDSVEVVRKSAAVSLGKLNDPRAIDVLIKSFKDKHYSVRMTASISLVKLGKPAVEPLLKVLNDPDDNTRYLAIESLGKIKDKRAVPYLLKKLKSEDWAERAFTIEALGTIGDSKGIKAVKKLAKTETHPFVKRKITETIEKLEAGQK